MNKSGHFSVMQNKELLNKLYWIDKKSLREIGIIYGVSAARVYKWCKRLDIETRVWTTKGLKFPNRKLSQEHKDKLRKWRTGRKLSPYLSQIVTKNLVKSWDKRRKKIGTIVTKHSNYLSIKDIDGKWKYLHRVIATKKIGRELQKGEEVHHINFNAKDNNPNNLLVLTRSEHLLLHSQLEHIMKELFIQNKIAFKDNSYCLI